MSALNRIFYQIRRYSNRAFSILANEGVAVLAHRSCLGVKRLIGMGYMGNFDHGYSRWRTIHGKSISPDDGAQLISGFDIKPLISIIMPVYNVEEKWLRAAIQSVIDQIYPHWQLCMVDDFSSQPWVREILEQYDDARIIVTFNESNLGISNTSNIALSLAGGEFIGFLDHDDILSADALLQVANSINKSPLVDLIYSDEDKVSIDDKYSAPFLKPDYSIELLQSHNYIGHFIVARKSIIDDTGGFQSGYDGAQDYDLLLRIGERTDRIEHIPKVLYHWREIPGSTATSFDAKSYAWETGQKALKDHFTRMGIRGEVTTGKHPGTYRTIFKTNGSPKVSVIIPFKDQPLLLDKCFESAFANSEWENTEVIAINNNSELDETKSVLDKWQKSHGICQLEYFGEFNFSAICNYGVNESRGDYIVLLNSDVELISPDWIETLLQHAQQQGVGAVGAKLLYSNKTIQHAGIVIGIDEGAGHPFKHFPKDHKGYFMRLDLVHNVSAVTAALMMVEKKKYIEVGEFDETNFTVAYNDVDFCLSLATSGYRNVITPHCLAIHRESSTRGFDRHDSKLMRHNLEKEKFCDKWSELFEFGDPYYNHGLTLLREDYSLR